MRHCQTTQSFEEIWDKAKARWHAEGDNTAGHVVYKAMNAIHELLDNDGNSSIPEDAHSKHYALTRLAEAMLALRESIRLTGDEINVAMVDEYLKKELGIPLHSKPYPNGYI